MEMLSSLDHPQTRTDIAIERAMMEQLGGGCYTPIGIYCRAGHLIAEVLSLDGKCTERVRNRGKNHRAGPRGRKEAEGPGTGAYRRCICELGISDEG